MWTSCWELNAFWRINIYNNQGENKCYCNSMKLCSQGYANALSLQMVSSFWAICGKNANRSETHTVFIMDCHSWVLMQSLTPKLKRYQDKNISHYTFWCFFYHHMVLLDARKKIVWRSLKTDLRSTVICNTRTAIKNKPDLNSVVDSGCLEGRGKKNKKVLIAWHVPPPKRVEW